ncbi:MAG: S8 family serine peptidase [Opitutaceae bacterium]|nr:S8 family serine peptidase [Opitutaceae bacterium]
MFALGLVCAGLLIWLWRRSLPADSAGTAPAGAGVVAAPRETVPPAPPAPADLAQAPDPLAGLARALRAGDVRTREAVLTFRDDEALQRFLARALPAGLTVVDRLDRLRAVRVRFDSLDELRRELRARGPDVSGAEANPLIGLPSPPAREDRAAVNHVPFGNETLAAIGAAADRSTWGRGTTIAILDTGVAGDATFGTGRLRTLDLGLGTAPGAGADDGHGTAVAALAAGAAGDAAGVAPAAGVLGIRVTDASGVSDLFTLSRAIVAAVDAGAQVINISLGGYATGPVLDAAIDYATRNGAVLVAAAGNDQAAQLAWPAADPRVISVGAVDRLEQQVTFSNSGAQLQLTAPGYGVQTAWLDGQRVQVSGTSASAPVVAGAIAAVMSQFPSLTAAQAAELLVSTANDGGTPGADPAYGRGILNVATALNRNNAAYVDTAVSSLTYDAATGQMQIVVQNRSGRSITGLALSINAGGSTQTQVVPSLSPGETHVARVPVSDSTLQAAGRLTISTRLTNPAGAVDQVPANNTRASVLTVPKP